MAESVKIPGVGPTNKKYVTIGLAVTAGIVAYAWWKRGSAVPAAVEGDVTGEDLAYSPDAYSGAIPGGSTVDPNPSASPLTNPEWAQRVIEMLENVGFDRNFAATTIGKYLSGQQLSTPEKLLVQAAIGLLGNPPAGSLPLIDAPTPVNPGSTGTKHTTVWQGHKITTAEGSLTLWNFASKFAEAPTNRDSVESTKRAMKVRNPTTLGVLGDRSKVKAGWIVLVPVRK